MASESKGFWEKLAAVTAFLAALGGLLAILDKCAGANPPPQTTSFPAPAPVAPPLPYTPVPYRAPTGGFCCDMSGLRRCQIAPSPLGSGCFCFGQGAGVTCP